nr:hypothetical protein [Tanacetum cinerariifolium]
AVGEREGKLKAPSRSIRRMQMKDELANSVSR